MRKAILSILILLLLASCSATRQEPYRPPQPVAQAESSAVPGESNKTTTETSSAERPLGKPLASFEVDIQSAFNSGAPADPSSSPIALNHWQPQAYAMQGDSLPVDLNSIGNPGVIARLTADQQGFLSRQGFLVTSSQDDQFYQIRDRVSKLYGQPYYLSTDAAYHALHLTFDALLKALEKERFRPLMIAITQATLDEVTQALPQLQGKPVEQDARLAADYLAVALRLFDPTAKIDAGLEADIAKQLQQVRDAAGRSKSALFPDFEDDYGAYKPVGHYSGDPELEAYFQAMTWLGRVHFPLQKAGDPGFKPSRVPLVITWALRRADLENKQTAAQAYGDIYEALTFLIGDSDDAGPVEYAGLMDEVYGTSAVAMDLADEALWQTFQERSTKLPAPQINSTFANFSPDMQVEKGWRFMGQRFTLDAFILQNLLFDKVGTLDNQRQVPSGLDVMSAFGSLAADEAQRFLGQEEYANYPEQMQAMRQIVQQQPENEWINRFYSGTLYSFLPNLAEKSDAYPPYMRTPAWEYKQMNTSLGAWAELKHDTALYTKMPEPMGGGGPPSSGPAPAYVEPNPDVFYRLAYISDALEFGLAERDLVSSADQFVLADPGDIRLDQLAYGLHRLAQNFQQIGDMAVKELAGQSLSEEDLWVVQGCLGPVECAVTRAKGYGQEAELDPMPLVAAVSGAGQNDVLEAGIGGLNRIYVVVPVEGKLEVAQGGVFSYYEFTQPRDERLTDQDWRVKLAVAPPEAPFWTVNFRLKGGETADSLAFRVNDVYLITAEGANLNVRAEPNKDARVLTQLQQYDFVTIIDGPVEADGYTWWKVRLEFEDSVGWAVQNTDWYERAWGQDPAYQ